VAVLVHNIWVGHGLMASAVTWAYNRSPWSGSQVATPPEAKTLLVFGRSMEAANLLTFLQYGNAKKWDICVIFAKNYG